MATATTFSVFPAARVPQISLPNPHNRKPSLRTIDIESSESAKESVVIALQEIPVPKIPKEYSSQVSTKSPTSLPPPPPAFQPATKPSVYKDVTVSCHSSPEPGSISSAETLVRSTSEDDAVVPIRSMFPVYNPNVPLNQQSYFPRRPNAPYSSQKQSVSTPFTPKTAQSLFAPSITGSIRSQSNLITAVDVRPTVSSASELEKLWDATQGTVDDVAIPSFDLEFSRLGEPVFVFGTSPTSPFYTITTYDTSEISITKTCPRKRTLNCDVVLTQIEAQSRRLPPNDGLVSYIFPKMAAMLAINQSNALAAQYDLAPTDRDDVQDSALKRAANQEASHLRWNATENRYELEHPAIARKRSDPDYIASPRSPSPEEPSALHINVVTSDHSSEEKPIILVTCPAISRPEHTSIGSIAALSANPEMASDVQLASLDLNTNILHIEANSILKLMPSLFVVDSIVSAIVCVAIADRDANAVMASTKIWAPRVASSPNMSSTPRTSTFYATIAEREEAESEAKAAAKAHKKSSKNKARSILSMTRVEEEVDLEAGHTWYGKSKAKKQKNKKKKQIVVGEFDLDKLTHYQSGSRQGEELPGITRGALTLMVSGLKFLVWFLTMIVQFLAWVMIALTRGLTSEKF